MRSWSRSPRGRRRRFPHSHSLTPPLYYYATSPTHPQYVNTVTTRSRALDDVFDIALYPTISFTSLGSLGSLDSTVAAGFFDECFGDGDGGKPPVFDADGELTHEANQAVDVPEYLACFDQSSTGTTAQQVAMVSSSVIRTSYGNLTFCCIFFPFITIDCYTLGLAMVVLNRPVHQPLTPSSSFNSSTDSTMSSAP